MKNYNQFILEKKNFGVPEKHITFPIDRIIPDIKIRKDILEIANIFWKNNYSLYIVGGAVRDSYLGKKSKDYDLVTDALPDISVKILSSFYKILPIGEAFGINKIMTENDGYELATFRKDIGSDDSRHPDSVEYADIYSDYKRRDLTCNSLFYDIKNEEIIDFCNGLEDIDKGIIKTVGNPNERFKEDRLRRLRTIRFASRFGSEIDEDTDKSLLKNSSLDGISYERIRDEFLKGIQSAKNVIYLMKLIEKYKMFRWIFPDLSINKEYIEEKDTIIQIAILLIDNNVDSVKRVLNKLTYSTDEIRDILFLINFSKMNKVNGLKPITNRADQNLITLKKLQKIINLNHNQILKFANHIDMDERLVEAFLVFDLSVNGEDIKKLGFKGVNIGKEIERIEIENFKKLLN